MSAAFDAQSGFFAARAPESGVMPVLTIANPADAQPLAAIFAESGLNVVEVTLRTDAALRAIETLASDDRLTVGVGTLVDAAQVRDALAAGAAFGVSPGATDAILDECAARALPFLPGVDSVSQAMRLRERGCRYQKFFPAEPSGGAGKLRALQAPLPDIRFCPTGGVSPENARDYLRLPNVFCVGGSWLAPPDLVARGDWRAIAQRDHDAAALRDKSAITAVR